LRLDALLSNGVLFENYWSEITRLILVDLVYEKPSFIVVPAYAIDGLRFSFCAAHHFCVF
jgi:hypothetical protein